MPTTPPGTVVLAQAAVSGDALATPARAVLSALLADPSPLTRPALTEALRRRAASPTMTRGEVELLDTAEELILSVGQTG
ncbi:hypothetical protein [Streptomyces purpurascens]|uniref:Uncharacterized protein n=1 Tax=Streptomyces purpurascens TaxID=1924 RepID=A0ABZ1MG18_STREF|nr:hypothetical protein [Streptomyces purpurascens]MCE7049449.1 hypothetical protein [Streptomyces purpurascens]GHA21730.1 hypothetical protein GCM10010303_35250 [Streptomyces purpurascens]